MAGAVMGIPDVVPQAPPAIFQQQKVEFDQLVSEIASLAITEDQNCLKMGDLFVKIEQQYGRKQIKVAAQAAGVSQPVADQRYWVAKKIPQGSPLRSNKMLSFAHLRLLAGMETPEEMEEWADKAVDEGWSTRQLQDALGVDDNAKAVEQGRACASCESSLDNPESIVTITIGGKGKVRCCKPECAITYLQGLVEEATTDPYAA